ncbi:MAG: hypothetical protein ACK46Q_03755 [Hyphomonas sp.]
MNRREVLTAAPVSLVASGLPLGALFAPGNEGLSQTPIMALFRRWRAAEAAEQEAYAEGAPDSRCKPLSDTRKELEDLIVAEPCQLARDWIAKAAALSAFGTFDTDLASHRRLWAEAREIMEVNPAHCARDWPNLPAKGALATVGAA